MSYTIIKFTTKELQQHLAQAQNKTVSYIQTPAGIMQVSSTELGIYNIQFIEQTEEKITPALDATKLLLVGTEFQQQVWQTALQIPAGTTLSYQELAAQIGRPKAHRALAHALGSNKIAYYIPCHRVVRKSGHIGGYRWGIERKKLLLAHEI